MRPPTGVSPCPVSKITLLTYHQGWIYFYNAKCKVVIDADLRDADVCRKATDLCSTGLPDLAEGTEMHVQFLDHFSGTDNRVEIEPAPLCLLVNHTECVASYVSGLPDAKNVELNPLDPNKCMYFLTVSKRNSTFGAPASVMLHTTGLEPEFDEIILPANLALDYSEQNAADVLELSMDSSCSRTCPRSCYEGRNRCTHLVLCSSPAFV